ncbi:MAG: extracellular solute-binding protein [Chloroflexi bacterium]|nr:extracellular solute-binding protein [Chloroflexota bacterium]
MSAVQKKLSRRDFLRSSALATAGVLLVGCAAPAAAPQAAPAASGGEAPAAPQQAINLSFWMWNTFAPTADEFMQEKLNEWAGANNVTIEISRDADPNMATKVMPSIEAGTLPDALFISGGVALQMMDAQSLEPLTDLFGEIGDAHGGWQPRLDTFATRNGAVSFLPYSIDTPMVQFRQDLFEAAGITVPTGQWTWDETRDLTAQASKYTEEQGSKLYGWGFGVVKLTHDGWCSDLFRNYGADIWDETGTKIILADEKMAEAVAALNFAKQAWDMGLFPPDAPAYDYAANNKAFLEKQALLVINAASIYVAAQDSDPELAEAMGLAPKPKALRDTTDASLRYTVVMSNKSKNKETASDLIRALYSSDIYAPWLERGFVANVLKEYDSLPMWEGKRAAFNLAAQIGSYPGYPAPFDNAAISELSGSPDSPVGSMVVRVLLDGWTPEDAIAEADTFSKRVFEKYF